MPLVVVPQVQPNDDIDDISVNKGPNALATVVNGLLDDQNISSLSGSKVPDGTLNGSKIIDKTADLMKIYGGTTAGVLVTTAAGVVSAGAKTTDANGWTVYDFGIYKEFIKIIGLDDPGTIHASGVGSSTGGNWPAGTRPVDLHIVGVTPTAASNTLQGRWFYALNNRASTETAPSLNVTVRNLTASSLTETGHTIVVTLRTR